ncbi:MAG: GNAT family N-acetyltransferase [Opitutus sp.]|nr:GNAT family N-acetyltransferase [Opitutus sp.]
MNFSLRPATADDGDWLYAVREATMRGYVEETFGFWDEAAQRERFLIPRELANMQIIAVDRRRAGLLHVERSAEGIFLANLQIDLPFQNRGLGTTVIRTLVAEAQAHGRAVWLQVFKVNQPARDLYARLGFVIQDESDTHTHMIWRPR